MSVLGIFRPLQRMEIAQRYEAAFIASQGLHNYLSEYIATDLYGLDDYLKISENDHLRACENLVYSRAKITES